MLLPPTEVCACLGVAPYPAIGTCLQIGRQVHQDLLIMLRTERRRTFEVGDEPAEEKREVPSTADVDRSGVVDRRCCSEHDEESIEELSEQQ